MSDLKGYLIGDYRETMNYVAKIDRNGLAKFPPLIISCAITGGLHGKEANPNLPEMPDEQVQATYDAYNAGASIVHIHARDKNNHAKMSQKWEDFLQINQMVRAKCPDLIINNTLIGGRFIDDDFNVAPRAWASFNAKPEIASIDLTCISTVMPMKARQAPLSHPREAYNFNFNYMMTQSEAIETIKEFNKHGIKPELEIFDIGNIKYIYNLINEGLLKGPYWCQMLFGGNGIFPSADNMLLAARTLPPESLFSIIGLGACQNAMITLGIILGHHVRVGLEDNVVYAPRELAKSNAQFVEKVVRIARELGRPIATPAQAREMLGLGAPRQY